MGRELEKVSVYINEADEWEHAPLHLALLRTLEALGVAGGTVVHGVAGFTAKGGVHSSSLVDTGGKLPLVIEFIDTPEKVAAVLPKVKQMVRHRLVVRQAVVSVE